MNDTFEKRSMAFMNCPWKSTAGCNYICVECFRSDPDGLKTLLDDFNRLGSGQKQRRTKMAEWISVKERLPEDGKEVLCWYEYFRYGSYNRMFQTYGIGQCYNKMWCGEVANGIRARVIAWMPLPEPPKGESNG